MFCPTVIQCKETKQARFHLQRTRGSKNNRNNQTIHRKSTSENDRDNSSHNQVRLQDTHSGNTNAALCCSVGSTDDCGNILVGPIFSLMDVDAYEEGMLKQQTENVPQKTKAEETPMAPKKGA